MRWISCDQCSEQYDERTQAWVEVRPLTDGEPHEFDSIECAIIWLQDVKVKREAIRAEMSSAVRRG